MVMDSVDLGNDHNRVMLEWACQITNWDGQPTGAPLDVALVCYERPVV